MKRWAAPLGILLIALLCFFVVSIFRYYHFDMLSDNKIDLSFRLNSEFTLTAIRTWLNKGFLNHNMTISLQVTYPGVPDRAPYFSYPQGFLFVPYIIASFLGLKNISIGFIDLYSAFLHFLIATCIGQFSWFVLKKLSVAWAFIAGAALSVFALFFGPLVVFFQNSYFSDQASVLPYILIVMGFHFYSQNPSTKNRALVMGLLFLGAWSDHSLVILGGISSLLLLRLWGLSRWKEIAFTFGAPIAVSSALFIYPLLWAERRYIYYFFQKLLIRNGVFGPFPSPYGAKNYWGYFQWISDFTNFQGFLSSGVMFLGIAAGLILFFLVLWKKWNHPVFNILILGTVPLFVHCWVFLQHYYLHPYNVVRTIIPLFFTALAAMYGILTIESMQKRRILFFTVALILPACLFQSIDGSSRQYLNTRYLSPHVLLAAEAVKSASNPGDLFVNTLGDQFGNNVGIFERWYQEIAHESDVEPLGTFIKKESALQASFQVALLTLSKHKALWTKKFPNAKQKEAGIVNVLVMPSEVFLSDSLKLNLKEREILAIRDVEEVSQSYDFDSINKVKSASLGQRISYIWHRSITRLNERRSIF